MIHLLDFYPSQRLRKTDVEKKTRVERRALILFKVLVAKDQKIFFFRLGRAEGMGRDWPLSAM